MLYRLLLFLLVNFAALGIGGLFTGKGVASEWYQNLNQAPWTPPGWVFGVAWSTIMICFAFYMSYAFKAVVETRTLMGLFIFQWVLNVLWNPIFFKYHQVMAGLVVISMLTVLVAYLLIHYKISLGLKSLLILPYFLWLLIATSLNFYIYLKN